MTARWKPTSPPAEGVDGSVAGGCDPRAKEAGVQIVDVRFTDLPGTWQHFSIPLKGLEEDTFTDGLGFDGSSIRGFRPSTRATCCCSLDPAALSSTPVGSADALMTCDIVDPITRGPIRVIPATSRASGSVPEKRAASPRQRTSGPRRSSTIFNSVRFDQNAHEGYYHIDSEEGIWNTGANGTPNLGHRSASQGRLFPVPPTRRLQDLRSKIMLAMIAAGIESKCTITKSARRPDRNRHALQHAGAQWRIRS